MKALFLIVVCCFGLSTLAHAEKNDFSVGGSLNYYADSLGIGLHSAVAFEVNPKMKIGFETGLHRVAKKKFSSSYNAEAATSSILIPAMAFARYYIQNNETKRLYIGASLGAVYLKDSSTLTLASSEFTENSSAILLAVFAKAGVEQPLSLGSKTYWYFEPNLGLVRDTLTIFATGGLRFPF